MKTKFFTLIVAALLLSCISFAQFVQQGPKLVGTGAVGPATQGYSVSISSDGNTAIVGGINDNRGQGAAWIYTRSGGVWSQQGAKLVGAGTVGISGQGYAVSISSDGNTAIVGGYVDNNYLGAAWIFTRSGSIWSQQGPKLMGKDAVGNAWQGVSVSISGDGNTAIIGGTADNGVQGAAWIYTRSGNVWNQQGSKLIGTGATGNARQGVSVSLSSDGNTAIVGGTADNGAQGATWVFIRSSGVWSQQGAKLVGTGAVGTAGQGYSISISSDGNTAIVEGFEDNSNLGAAWLFARSAGVWTQKGPKLVGTDAAGNAFQAHSVSISSDGNTAIVGGYKDNSSQGAAWVYIAGTLATSDTTVKIITTVAGNGNYTGLAGRGDGGPAVNAIFNNPEAVFVDRVGNIYFPDSSTWVRKVDASGIITTIAGTALAGFSGDGGLATGAQLNQPFGIYVDRAGNIYIGTTNDSRIRKINPAGIISTVAGNGTGGYSGDGGAATNASIQGLQGITGDVAGNIYFTDFFHGVVRKVNTLGIVSTIAGTGTQGYSGDGGAATAAQLGSPNGVSIDAAGNMYISDDYPNVVRKINTSGIISTVAGGSATMGDSGDGGLATTALFGDIESVISDEVGNLYIVDAGNQRIRRVDALSDTITAFAGTGVAGFSGDGGPAISAEFNSPWTISQDTAGSFYIGDLKNERIRKISISYTLATSNITVTQFLNIPFSTNINDDSYHRLLSITPTAGSNMVNGNVTFKLTFDPTVQTYAGVPYVQRHYDITPAANAATAQATVKLYFLQSEFNAYNTYVTTNNLGLPFLPTNPADLGSVKNIIVNQFHGLGSAPGNYTGTTVNIKPTATWDAIDKWWEVVFPVTGFSGFYVNSVNSALPLTLLNFTGNLQNNNVILSWQTAQEINTLYFDIERSADGNNFSSIGNVNASGNSSTTKNYSYTDQQPLQGTNFYHLRMVDKDGKYTYSKIVAIKMDGKNSTLQIFPNPAKNILNVQVTGANESATLQIIDMTGRKMIEEKIMLNGNTSFSVDINNLSKGTYNLLLKSKSINEQKKFVKE